MWFIRALREWISKYGSQNVVYMDESGFEAHSYRPHGYAKRGVKLYDKVTGNKKKGRINLIMAQRGKEWLAPVTFTGSCHHAFVTGWFEQCLLPELRPNSLVIIDNAPFHNKTNLRKLLEENGHSLLPLPTYSPDLNPIEQTFAILKKRKQATAMNINQLLDNYYCE